MDIKSHFVIVPIQSGWQTKTKIFFYAEDMIKIYHWILEWGEWVACIWSNLEFAFFFKEEMDKTNCGRKNLIIL